MHTGYYFGFFLAALANYFIGANYGWRWMFVFGGLPALLIAFIRYGVRESTTWKERSATRHARGPRCARRSRKLFSPAYARRTMVMSLLFLVSIIGLWAGSIYVPTAMTQIGAARAARAPPTRRGWRRTAAMVLALGTILGCLAAPLLAERLGRRKAMAIYFVLMVVHVARRVRLRVLPAERADAVLPVLFLLGLGGANFALYTLWLPEQYTTDCRASAIAFISSVGRFVGVAMVFLVGRASDRMAASAFPWPSPRFAFVFGLMLAAAQRGDARQVAARVTYVSVRL